MPLVINEELRNVRTSDEIIALEASGAKYFTTGHLRSTSGTMRRMEIENDDEPLIHHPVSPDEVQRAHNE